MMQDRMGLGRNGGRTMGPDETGPDDVGLVAYLDGVLAAEDHAAMDRRLATEPALRARLDVLSRGDRPYREAFDVMTSTAPKARLEAMLAEALASRPAPAPPTAKAPVRWSWFAFR